MPTGYLSMTQIAAYAKGAGFSGDRLVVATAVAYAESNGNPKVVNFLGCVGLWQIYRRVHQKSHPSWTQSWLQQPANNATAAYALSSGGKNWRPWEAYTNGAYKRYLAAAKKAVSSAPNLPPAKGSVIGPGVTAARVLSIAASQIGYTESPPGSNRTKYWAYFGFNQGLPWCGGFTTWCMRQAGMSMSEIKRSTGPNPFAINGAMKPWAAAKKGRLSQTPKPGCWVLFKFSHVGLVEKVLSDGRIQTIEGNTSPSTRGSQNNGGCVARKIRSRSSIHGFLHFNYDAGGVVSPTSPDWQPGADTAQDDISKTGILTVNGVFNTATMEVMSKYFGFDAATVTTSLSFWKNIEKVAWFPVKYQNGVLDTETIQFVQWATENRVTGVWNATTIRGIQSFLNEYTAGRKQNYASMIAGTKV